MERNGLLRVPHIPGAGKIVVDSIKIKKVSVYYQICHSCLFSAYPNNTLLNLHTACGAAPTRIILATVKIFQILPGTRSVIGQESENLISREYRKFRSQKTACSVAVPK